MKQDKATVGTQDPEGRKLPPNLNKRIEHRIFLALCKLTGADDEDHQETENEVLVAKAISALFKEMAEEVELNGRIDELGIAKRRIGDCYDGHGDFFNKRIAALKAKKGMLK